MLTNMLKNKKIFIFDMDGTLVESLGVWGETEVTFIYNTTGTLVDKKEISDIRDEFLGNSKDPNPYISWVAYLKELYQMTGDLDDLVEYRKSISFKILEHTVSLKPYAKELLTLLKENGYTVCLASVGAKESLNRMLYQIPATSFLGNNIFDLIMDSSSVKKLKPNPDVHLKILEHFNAKVEDAVIIEDSLVGLMASNNAGVDAVIVKEPLNKECEKVKNMASFYVDSLESVYNSVLEITKKRPKYR